MFFFKKREKSPIDNIEGRLPEGSISDAAGLQGNANDVGSKYFAGSALSDVGCVRPNNEDNYILETHINRASSDYSEFSVPQSDPSIRWHLAAVFDGIGGGDCGEVASQKTAQIFLEAIRSLKKDSSKSDIDQAVKAAFLKANNMVLALQKESHVFGTTGTVLCTDCKEYKIYHLGDSRAYLIRDGCFFQLTKDQTLAQMKIDAGLYSADAPEAATDRHKLTEYIGRDWTQKNLRPTESEWSPIRQADRLLLCSDGLYDMCKIEEMEQILRLHGTADMQARALVEAARCNGGADNITCIILAFP